MKNTNRKLISLLLVAAIAVCAMFPCIASAAWTDDDRWEDDFAGIEPAGDEPYAKVKLTATGYEFTDWYIPTDYSLKLLDGGSKDISAEIISNIGVADPDTKTYPLTAGYTLKADVDGITYYFSATLTFHEKEQTCIFTVWQAEMVENEDGSVLTAPVATLLREECENEVDNGTVFTRAAYWFYGILVKINDWMEEKFHRGFLL